MNIISELDWVQFKDTKGALILSDAGLYYQPYDISERRPYPLGDSLAINRTGLFGAAHMASKFDKDDSDFAEIAKAVRIECGLEKLIDEGRAIFIDWKNVARAKIED